MKSDRFYTTTTSLLGSIAFIFLGVLILVGKDRLYFDVIKIFTSSVLILGFVQFVRYFIFQDKSVKKKISFIKCMSYCIFFIIVSCFPEIPISILPILFAIYMLCNGIIKLIFSLVIYLGNKFGFFKEFIVGIVYLGIGIPLLIFPIKNVNNMLVIIGVYLILLGVNFFVDFVLGIIPVRVKTKLRRKIRISLPVILQAIIPFAILNEINALFANEDYDRNIVETKKSDDDIDMEIFIHTSLRGYNRMGHVDIAYGDKVYVYGNYDDASHKLFGVFGDGVLFTCQKKDYIPFCIKHSYKTLIGFGVKLNDKQKKNVEKYIKELLLNSDEWFAPVYYDKNKSEDYASSLYNSTKAKFYKFRKGKYKNFFILGTNCVLLADSIIGKSGSDILKINGIITPGTYYEYLNREFNKKKSNVISKRIYNAETTIKKKINDKK